MSGSLARVAGWLVEHRTALPRWMVRIMESAARDPDGFVGRTVSRFLVSGDAPVTTVPDTATRVYIAPTNYSGQGYRWARALEADRASIGARNAAVQLPGGFAFPADTSIPIATVMASREWADAEWQSARRFTHVLVEAERSMFGARFERDVRNEVAALEAEGISVAFISHGTDIRDPDHHMALTPHSPYPGDPRTDFLRVDAARNRRLLEELRRPTFVSTPDLLLDLPWAQWCPVVTDPDAFATADGGFDAAHVRVIHASSDPVQKGSDLIAPALEPLVNSGAVIYRAVNGTPSAQMPAAFAAADIVIDQLRLGSYGVAACEALAAGRVVIGHVLPEVRARVHETTGLELPIIEATADTLAAAVATVCADRDEALRIAARGPAFVRAVHAGSFSARVLRDHWIDAR